MPNLLSVALVKGWERLIWARSNYSFSLIWARSIQSFIRQGTSLVYNLPRVSLLTKFSKIQVIQSIHPPQSPKVRSIWDQSPANLTTFSSDSYFGSVNTFGIFEIEDKGPDFAVLQGLIRVIFNQFLFFFRWMRLWRWRATFNRPRLLSKGGFRTPAMIPAASASRRSARAILRRFVIRFLTCLLVEFVDSDVGFLLVLFVDLVSGDWLQAWISPPVHSWMVSFVIWADVFWLIVNFDLLSHLRLSINRWMIGKACLLEKIFWFINIVMRNCLD